MSDIVVVDDRGIVVVDDGSSAFVVVEAAVVEAAPAPEPGTTVSVIQDAPSTVVVGESGPQGPPGASGPAGLPGDPGPTGAVGPSGAALNAVRLAGVDLSGHRAVVPLYDGSVVYATNVDPSHQGRPVWLTTGAALAGAEVQLLVVGELVEPTWAWAEGQPIFLGENGQLTQTAPTQTGRFVLQVAHATSSTKVFFNPKIPVVLV